MSQQWLALVPLFFISTELRADEQQNTSQGKVILGIEIGTSSFDLEKQLLDEIDPADIDDDGVSATYSAAYRWSNNIVVEGSLNYAGNVFFNFGLGDFYDTAEAKLLVGYTIPVAEHFRLVPMVGVSSWDIEIQEGAFLNPGPEAEAEADGTDLSYKLSAEFPFSSGFVLSLSYANTQTDIGDLSMTQAGVKFEF